MKYVRVIIGAMVFMTTFTNYMIRSSMSVSAVAMSPLKPGKKPVCDPNAPNKTHRTGDFKWGKNINRVIGGYFYGFLVTSLPAGMVANYFGAYYTILVSSALIGILNSCTVLIATYDKSWEAVFAVRFIIGMLGGFAYPAAQSLIAHWAPPNEKGKFLAAMMGNTLGTVITWPIVGTISETSWQWGFHALTFIQGLFCVVFAIVTTNSPEDHRWITEEEKNYIIESQKGHVAKKAKKVPPYGKILLSIPFWAMTMAQFGNLWCLNLILTYAPKYLKRVQGFDLKAASSLAAAPYLTRLLCSILFGSVGDYMRKKEYFSVTTIRKIFVVFSHIIPALMFSFIYLAKCSSIPVVIILILNQGFNGAVVVGHLQNPQDLSPNYAGTLYGLFSFFGGTTGVFVPEIGTAIEKSFDDGDLMVPGHIFMVGATALIATAIIFFVFGTGEVQPWNEVIETPKPGTAQEHKPEE